MKTITIRLEEDVYNTIESLRKDQTKSDFYRSVIQDHIKMNTSDHTQLQNEYTQLQNEYMQLQNEYNTIKAVHEVTDARVLDLQTQVGFMLQQFTDTRPQLTTGTSWKDKVKKILRRNQ